MFERFYCFSVNTVHDSNNKRYSKFISKNILMKSAYKLNWLITYMSKWRTILSKNVKMACYLMSKWHTVLSNDMPQNSHFVNVNGYPLVGKIVTQLLAEHCDWFKFAISLCQKWHLCFCHLAMSFLPIGIILPLK